MKASHARGRHAITTDLLIDTCDVRCGSDLRQPQPIILSVYNPLPIFITSRSRLLLDQPLLGNSHRNLRGVNSTSFPPVTLQLNLLVIFYPNLMQALSNSVILTKKLSSVFTCPQVFIIIIVILKEKGVVQMNRLADVYRDTFAKL